MSDESTHTRSDTGAHDDTLEMPLTEHLEELRRRILVCLAAVAIAAIGSYVFSEWILKWLVAPYQQSFPDAKVVFIKPTEAFLTYLKVSLIAGFFISSPIILYEIWAFVAPGLYRHERVYTIAVLIPSAILFLTGAAFSYFVVLPYGLRFLIGAFSGNFLNPMISIREYLSFVFTLAFSFGVAFLSPVVMILLGTLGIISYEDIKRFRPYAAVAVFTLAAILTPPDVFTQISLAVPLLILFEIGALGVKITGLLRKEENQGDDEPS